MANPPNTLAKTVGRLWSDVREEVWFGSIFQRLIVFWWFLQTYMRSGSESFSVFKVCSFDIFWDLGRRLIHCRAVKISLRGTNTKQRLGMLLREWTPHGWYRLRKRLLFAVNQLGQFIEILGWDCYCVCVVSGLIRLLTQRVNINQPPFEKWKFKDDLSYLLFHFLKNIFTGQ